MDEPTACWRRNDFLDEGFSFGGFGDVANECGDSGNVFLGKAGQ